MNKIIARHRFGVINPHLDLALGQFGPERSFISAFTENEYQNFLVDLEEGKACLFPEIVVKITSRHQNTAFLLLGEAHTSLQRVGADPFVLKAFTDGAFRSCSSNEHFMTYIKKWVNIIEEPKKGEQNGY